MQWKYGKNKVLMNETNLCLFYLFCINIRSSVIVIMFLTTTTRVIGIIQSNLSFRKNEKAKTLVFPVTY